MLTTTLYALFAALATLLNLAAQALTWASYRGPGALLASIGVGTAAGLALKYALDKRYIFRFETRDLAHDGRLFALYSCMGLVTTALFWGTELAFQRLFHTDALRYVGGALGLAVGYLVKFNLDRRFVFRQS
jgi:putative flippase GtrA